MPDRFPRSLRIFATASVPGFTPAASPRTAYRRIGPGLPTCHRLTTSGEERPPDRALSSTAARSIHQIWQTADDSRGFNHRFSFLAPIPSSLAGTNHLVVSVRPYVVEAASSFTPNPGFCLPPASASHCDDQRRVLPPARFLSASWRTTGLVDDQNAVIAAEAVRNVAEDPITECVSIPAGGPQ